MEGTHYISTKQVPSALILAKAGSISVRKNRDHLVKSGFQIDEEYLDEEGNLQVRVAGTDRAKPFSYSESLGSLIREAGDIAEMVTSAHDDDLDDYEYSGSETSDSEDVLKEGSSETIRVRKNLSKRIKYEDPWKIHAASALCNQLGLEGPKIVVWSGDGIRLSDPLPPRLFGKAWTGSLKNRQRFFKVSSSEVKLHILMKHTHWGRRLANECSDPTGQLFGWARTLRRRINRFLLGGPDPIWTSTEREGIAGGEYKYRDRSSRSLRLIELLKTVDGVFIQRYLANPTEVWTWNRYDLFTLGTISMLIGDEFLDGEVSTEALDIRTSYAKLKGARKWFKLVAHKGQLESLESPPEGSDAWYRLCWNSWKTVTGAAGYENLMRISILSQTRGAGTPPPLVVLQSKLKFLKTVSTEAGPEDATMRSLRDLALQEVIKDLPVEATTGLATKARVTVASSACWEKTRKEGGTTEAIKEMLTSVDSCRQVPVRNLDTGRAEAWLFPDDFGTVGERIFWTSLDQVLRTPPEELRTAFLTVVKEPGKARSVTKARACLKIVLDTVSKLCSEPLAKGIRSSHSGMTAANHGWNFFNSLSTGEEKYETYRLLRREESHFADYVERTDVYENLYVSSTDYQEATDRMRHDVAASLGRAWMTKCGIPKLLRGIVIETCYKPRKIFFKATGCLKEIGARTEDEDIRFVTLRQGVLMGDPLTKPVLHLTNVCTRHLEKRLLSRDFYSQLPNSNEIGEFLSEWKEARLSTN